MHYQIDKIPSTGGFAATNMRAGDFGWILTSATITSEEPLFQKYMRTLSGLLLTPKQVPINATTNLLAVLHDNDSCDVYLNDFKVTAQMRGKTDIEAEKSILDSQIYEITRISFPDIVFDSTDRVIVCLKIGWRFALFFDLDRGQHFAPGTGTSFNQMRMEQELAKVFSRLLFFDIFKTIEVEPHYSAMVDDGWFPFIELIPNEYDALSQRYEGDFEVAEKNERLVKSFTAERVDRIAEKWWKADIFASRRILIEAGIEAFHQATDSGYINCISTLWNQIDGILREILFQDTGKGRYVKSKAFIRHLGEIVENATQDSGSVLFPNEFSAFLSEYGYKNFNLETGEIDFSRNSVGHGALDATMFTRIRAVQLILILDQIYFFHRSRSS